MKKQTSIFDNEVREKPLSKKSLLQIQRLEINCFGKEYLTKQGKIIYIEKRNKFFTGVGYKTFYKITYEGEYISPLQYKGVINFINNH